MQKRTRRIVITGVLSAISIFLGMTRLGFIPWISGASLTIMQVPVIIGAILEGPVVGMVIGLVFGVFSLIQAAVAPTGPTDVWFTNPLLSILPRLFIGPMAWLVYSGLRRWKVPAIIAAGSFREPDQHCSRSGNDRGIRIAALGCASRHHHRQWIA